MLGSGDTKRALIGAALDIVEGEGAEALTLWSRAARAAHDSFEDLRGGENCFGATSFSAVTGYSVSTVGSSPRSVQLGLAPP